MNNPSESKLFGLPRPLAGALIGIIIFLLILLPLKYLDYDSLVLYILSLDLEFLGRMIVLIFGMSAKIDLPQSVTNLASLVISATPAWIAGWQIGSPKKSTRTQGIIFLAVYLLFILSFGTFVALAGI